jgi:hypothetical protein
MALFCLQWLAENFFIGIALQVTGQVHRLLMTLCARLQLVA